MTQGQSLSNHQRGALVSDNDDRPPTPTHKHRTNTEPCTVDSNGELDDVEWWSSMPLRGCMLL